MPTLSKIPAIVCGAALTFSQGTHATNNACPALDDIREKSAAHVSQIVEKEVCTDGNNLLAQLSCGLAQNLDNKAISDIIKKGVDRILEANNMQGNKEKKDKLICFFNGILQDGKIRRNEQAQHLIRITNMLNQ